MKKKELVEEVENLAINNCNLCMNEITLENQLENLKKENEKLKQELAEANGNLEFKIDEKNFWKHECVTAENQNKELFKQQHDYVIENKKLKQDLRSIKTHIESYFKNKTLRPVTKSEMLLDAFYCLLNEKQYQQYFVEDEKLKQELAEYEKFGLDKDLKEFRENKIKKYNYEAVKIDDLIPLLRPGWVAMDEDYLWKWFLEKPELYKNDKGLWISSGKSVILDKSAFYIEPVEDWKTSLRRIG